MDLKQLYTECRTYRRFRQEPVSEEILTAVMENVRLASCGNNRQRLTYVLVTSEEACAQMAQFVRYAASLPPEIGQPKENELPAAYIVIEKPEENSPVIWTDLGIAANMICTSLYEYGVGSCMMMNFRKNQVNALIGAAEGREAGLVISLGYPDHTSTVVPAEKDSDLRYYVDDDRNYYVPKRPLEELVRKR